MRTRVELIKEILADRLYDLPVNMLDSEIISELEDIAKEVNKISSVGTIKVHDLNPGMFIRISGPGIFPGEYTYVGYNPGYKNGWRNLILEDIFGNKYDVNRLNSSVVELVRYKY